MIPDHILNRKGARSVKNISSEALQYLNSGEVETKNLMEWLSVDQLKLLKSVLSETENESWYEDICSEVSAQKKRSANNDVKCIGLKLSELSENESFYNALRNHTSDVVRSWACWAESLFYDSIPSLLKAMKPYAADTHFGVREVVIFASKDRLAEDLNLSLKTLTIWASSEDENIRRYSTEVLRPIGVWTKKITELQTNPEKAKALLELLNSDKSKYVRDAVGNWLNDASKTSQDWVKNICHKWASSSSSKETAYIIKKALRTIEKG